jgi:hypothetical protein
MHHEPMSLWDQIVEALSMGFGMFWEILWALILGFAISAVVLQHESHALYDEIASTISHRATSLRDRLMGEW